MSRHEKVTFPPKNGMKRNSFWYLCLWIYLSIEDIVIHKKIIAKSGPQPPSSSSISLFVSRHENSKKSLQSRSKQNWSVLKPYKTFKTSICFYQKHPRSQRLFLHFSFCLFSKCPDMRNISTSLHWSTENMNLTCWSVNVMIAIF